MLVLMRRRVTSPLRPAWTEALRMLARLVLALRQRNLGTKCDSADLSSLAESSLSEVTILTIPLKFEFIDHGLKNSNVLGSET